MAGPIAISILANASQANSTLADSESRFSRWGKGIAKAGAIAGAAIGAAVVGIGVASVKSASDAQQSLGATETVFGKYASTVIKKSNEAAMAVGLSANEYRELSNVMGASLAGAGIPLEKVTSLTEDLNKRAADMSATFGGTTADAIGAIGSLMRGEADPIEAYGVSIKATDVSARLAAKGLSGLTGEGLKQAEMQARVELLMEKTAVTQGAFAKESNTLAGQQQRLGAVWENLKAKIGTALLPALTALATAAVSTLNKISEYGPQVRAIVSVLGERLRPALQAAQRFLVGLGEAIKANVVPVLRTMVATFTGTVLPALTTFGAYVSAQLLPVFKAVWGVIQAQVIPILTSLATFVYGTLYPALVAIATAVAVRLQPVFETLVSVFMTSVLPTAQKLLAKFAEWQPTIQRVIGVVVQVTGKVLAFAASILGVVLPPLIRFAGFLIANVVPAVAGVIGIIVRIIAKIVDFGGALVTGVQKAGEFARGIGNKFADAVTWVTGLPGRVVRAIGDVGRLLYEIGKDIVRGLIDGLEAMAGALGNAVGDLAGSIAGGVGDFLGIASPSKVMRVLGRWSGKGLALGLDDEARRVERSADGLARAATPDLRRMGRLTRDFGWESALTMSRRTEETIRIELSAQAVDQLSRGRQVAADLSAFQRSGGRVATA